MQERFCVGSLQDTTVLKIQHKPSKSFLFLGDREHSFAAIVLRMSRRTSFVAIKNYDLENMNCKYAQTSMLIWHNPLGYYNYCTLILLAPHARPDVCKICHAIDHATNCCPLFSINQDRHDLFRRRVLSGCVCNNSRNLMTLISEFPINGINSSYFFSSETVDILGNSLRKND
jgi:hypothetical protein